MIDIKYDIVDIVVVVGLFMMLVVVVGVVGFVDMLKGEGLFMVFVLIDDVFVVLLEGIVEDLIKFENKDKLIVILFFYVLLGVVMVVDVSGKVMDLVIAGGVIVYVDGIDGVMVNGVKVVIVDIVCINGVIYVIDMVLLLIG